MNAFLKAGFANKSAILLLNSPTLNQIGKMLVDSSLKHDLMGCETDVEGALVRLSGSEPLYLSCLELFLEDSTAEDLGDAIRSKAWDSAFTAAHALKGIAGNMGFIPLFHSTAEIVILIRAGRINEIEHSYRELRRCYQKVTAAIQNNLPCINKVKEETL